MPGAMRERKSTSAIQKQVGGRSQIWPSVKQPKDKLDVHFQVHEPLRQGTIAKRHVKKRQFTSLYESFMKIIDFLYGQNLVWSNINTKCTLEIFLLALMYKIENLIRGGVKIEKQENFGQSPN